MKLAVKGLLLASLLGAALGLALLSRALLAPPAGRVPRALLQPPARGAHASPASAAPVLAELESCFPRLPEGRECAGAALSESCAAFVTSLDARALGELSEDDERRLTTGLERAYQQLVCPGRAPLEALPGLRGKLVDASLDRRGTAALSFALHAIRRDARTLTLREGWAARARRHFDEVFDEARDLAMRRAAEEAVRQRARDFDEMKIAIDETFDRMRRSTPGAALRRRYRPRSRLACLSLSYDDCRRAQSRWRGELIANERFPAEEYGRFKRQLSDAEAAFARRTSPATP